MIAVKTGAHARLFAANGCVANVRRSRVQRSERIALGAKRHERPGRCAENRSLGIDVAIHMDGSRVTDPDALFRMT